jgi:hypothetical protein
LHARDFLSATISVGAELWADVFFLLPPLRPRSYYVRLVTRVVPPGAEGDQDHAWVILDDSQGFGHVRQLELLNGVPPAIHPSKKSSLAPFMDAHLGVRAAPLLVLAVLALFPLGCVSLVREGT